MFGFEIGGASDIGNSRKVNQDSFMYDTKLINGMPFCICCVADGMGGLSEGEYASKKAIELTMQWWNTYICDFATKKFKKDKINRELKKLFYMINDEIFFYSLIGKKKIGTTYSLLLIIGDTYYVVHAGDSRIYLSREEKLYLLTKDQTWVNEQLEGGIISSQEAMQHPKKNMLTNCIGVFQKPSVCIGTDKVKENDKYLLCSDGLYNETGINDIVRVLNEQQPQNASKVLVNIARERGGRDNITAVALSVLDFEKMGEITEML